MQSRRFHLEVLDVREPCTEDWSRMRGDERTRFCATCANDVHDLSKMTSDEAEALLSRAEGRVCVRFYRRADGTVTTLDCAPQRFEALRRRTRRALAFAAAMVVSTVSAVLGLGLTTGETPTPAQRVERWIDPEPVIMGEAPIDVVDIVETDVPESLPAE
jgi:hypothetical protein